MTVAEQSIEVLIEALKSSDWVTRRKAVRELTLLGDERVVEPLISVLTNLNENDHVRAAAAQGLAAFNAHQAKAALLEALKEENNYRLRQPAIGTLSQLAELDLLEFFIAKLKDEDSVVQGYAIEALSKISDKRAVQPLLDLLLNEDEFFVIRASAAQALGKLGFYEAAPGLIVALDDEEAEVRWATAQALGALSSIEALPALTRMQQNDNGETFDHKKVKDAVEAALKRIGVRKNQEQEEQKEEN